MLFKTHLAFGFLIGLLSMKVLHLSYPILFICLVMLFSSLPDIDERKSKISRKFPFIAIPVSLIFKHRGFFHSVFPAIGLLFIFNYLHLKFLAMAIFIGYTAHLLADAFTKEGINFLHPISTFHIKGFIQTGALLESCFFVLLIVLDIFYFLKFFSII